MPPSVAVQHGGAVVEAAASPGRGGAVPYGASPLRYGAAARRPRLCLGSRGGQRAARSAPLPPPPGVRHERPASALPEGLLPTAGAAAAAPLRRRSAPSAARPGRLSGCCHPQGLPEPPPGAPGCRPPEGGPSGSPAAAGGCEAGEAACPLRCGLLGRSRGGTGDHQGFALG